MKLMTMSTCFLSHNGSRRPGNDGTAQPFPAGWTYPATDHWP